MKTLTIKDLVRTEELDRNAMAAVHGGTGSKMAADYNSYSKSSYTPSFDFDSSIHVKQNLLQSQVNPTGNGSAVFGGSISAENFQLGQNNVFA